MADDFGGDWGSLGGYDWGGLSGAPSGGGDLAGGGGGFDWSSLFSKDNMGMLGMAGGLGQQLMSILQGNRAPRQDRQAPFQMQANAGPDPNQLRSIIANKQASGQSSGGVVSPASIAAIMGQGQSQIDPRLMQLIMQYTQQMQQV